MYLERVLLKVFPQTTSKPVCNVLFGKKEIAADTPASMCPSSANPNRGTVPTEPQENL